MSNNNNFKKIIYGIIFFVAAIVCISSSAYIATHFLSQNHDSEYIIPDNESVKTSTKKVDSHNINWKNLSKNKDVFAWIYIPNTKIDYAVARAGKDNDDSFYLNHNIDREYEFSGAIYAEKQNSTDFSDPVTVLYGHNMLNGTMFAGLHKFEKKSFFKKNKYIYIYTPDRKLTYEIYAAYQYDDRHILNTFDLDDKKVLLEYFKSTLNPKSDISNVRDVDLDENSKTIALSTCTNGASNTRYIVSGVLVKDERAE